MPGKNDNRITITIVGPGNVGKSFLMSRFVDKSFDDTFKATIGVDWSQKDTHSHKGIDYRLIFWDTSGQLERFKDIRQAYYRSADVILLVYDVSDNRGFGILNALIEEVKQRKGRFTEIFLVGNKIDLRDNNPEAENPEAENFVSPETGKAFADQHKLHFYEVSAKTDAGLQQLLSDAIDAVLPARRQAKVDADDFSRFKIAYLKNHHIFASTETGKMCSGLITGKINTIVGVINYVGNNPNSRSARVFYTEFNKLFQQTDALDQFQKFQIAYHSERHGRWFKSNAGMFRALQNGEVTSIDDVKAKVEANPGCFSSRIMAKISK